MGAGKREGRTMTHLEIFETIGAVLGVLGAALLATNTRLSGWGYALFLASNAALLAFGYLAEHWRFVAMQLVFTATSLLGLWRWVIAPRLHPTSTKSDRIAALPPIALRPLPVLTPEELALVPLNSVEDVIDHIDRIRALNSTSSFR
eukprot:TRINITY_DN9163_c0_g1_i4.p1 TRINITY_DN9163_c0_g1~~TRINITY_DN9163_c0_g1_i4.p1  ORF type:complete len:147 (-),score=28.40 TRINITY_DN9163_c0_g1_i4:95-535(-)